MQLRSCAQAGIGVALRSEAAAEQHPQLWGDSGGGGGAVVVVIMKNMNMKKMTDRGETEGGGLVNGYP